MLSSSRINLLRQRLQQRSNNINVNVLILSAILILFAGCSEKPVTPEIPKPVSGTVKEAKQPLSEPASIQATSVTEEAPSGYNYRPSGRRDPFRSLILGLKEKKMVGLTPLQQRSLGELKVIGIMWEGKSYVAMIETPDAKGYLIREGVLVGPEGGVVKKISEDSVIIEEIFTDFYGRKKSKKTVLGLRPKEEGGG